MHDNNKYKERYVRLRHRWEKVAYLGWGMFVASLVALFVVGFAPGSSAWANPFGLQNREFAPLCGILLAFAVLALAGMRQSRLERIIQSRYVNKIEG